MAAMLLSALGAGAGPVFAADPPTVVDFSVTGSPSRTGSMTFSLTFSAGVSGLESSDLSLAAGAGAAAGCVIGAPAGGAAAYTVAVSGCSDGSVGLVLAAHSVGLAGEETTTGPLEPAASAVGAVDRVAPSVVSFTVVSATPVSGPTIQYSLTFSEPVVGLDAGDFRVFPEVTSQPWKVTGVSGSGAEYVVALGRTTVTSSGTVTLRLKKLSVTDLAGNVGPTSYREAPSVSYVAGGVDTIRPKLASFTVLSATPVAGTAIEYRLVFTEPVVGLEPADFRVFPETAAQPWAVTSVSGADAEYVVTLGRTTATAGTVTLRLKKLSVADLAGNLGPKSYREAPAVSYTGGGTPGAATIGINGGASSTSDPTLKLALATTLGPNVEVRFSIDGGKSWTPYQQFAANRDLVLPVKHPWGTVGVSGEFRDGGGRTATASASISYTQAQRSTMALRASYDITATLDYANGRINARQVVALSNSSSQVLGYLDFSVFPRQFDKLTVSAVSVDGKPLAPTYTNKANMRVPLGFNLRPGEGAQVRIDFVAHATSDTSDYLRSRLSKADGLMQVSSWHPLLSDGHGVRLPGDSQFSASADYRLDLSHPSNVVIAAPGTIELNNASRKVFRLANAREYAFAASPNFATMQATTAQGVKVIVYYLPGTANVGTGLNAAVRSMEKHHVLGAYPYKRLVVAQGTRPSLALEYSGMIYMGRNVMGHALTMAHEVAHQWWYGIVGNDQLQEPWLDEGFSEFTSRWFSNSSMPTTYCSSRPVNSSIYEWSNSATSGCGSYGNTVYFKGAVLLDGVRTRMGDGPFMNALKAMVAENRFGILTTATARETFMRYASNKPALKSWMDQFLRP
jgi:hypothetical protein